MSKLYTTNTGKTIAISNQQFRKLAEALYNAIARNAYTAVVVLDDITDDSIMCYQQDLAFACKRRIILDANACNYELPLALFSSPFYPTFDCFVGMLWCVGDCTVEIYDNAGLVHKKTFSLRGV